MSILSNYKFIYCLVFLPTFLLGFILKLDNAPGASEQLVMFVSLLALGALVASLCGCLFAARIEGGKGLLKGLALIFIALLDSAFVYAFAQSIGNETFVGAIVVIILVAVANAVVARKWFIEPPRSPRS